MHRSTTTSSLRRFVTFGVGFQLAFLAAAFACPLIWTREGGNSGYSADTAAAHVGTGYDEMAAQRYSEAIREFQAALSVDPKLVRVRYQLAVCYYAVRKTRESRQEFDRLLAETGQDASVIYYLGRLDLDEGNLDSAIRRFQSLAVRPPFSDTAYYLGTAYLRKGDLDAAERWLTQAARMMPRDFRVHDHLARVYQKKGRAKEAEKEYTLSSDLRRTTDDASRQAVNCSLALDSQPLAEAHATCQLLFDPNDPDKLATLGLLYGQHGDYAEALEPLTLASRLDPESSEFQHDLGLTYFRLKRYADARGPLERATALRPDFFGSNAVLGATLYMLEEDEEAYRVLQHAYQLNPQDLDTANLFYETALHLAKDRYVKRRYPECLGYLQKATELQPDDAETHQRLHEVYKILGQNMKAEREEEILDRLGASRH